MVFFLVQYAVGDPVMLWVNKVGPDNNPQETYNYYSLPYCKPGKADAHHKWGGLGEVLQGNELIDSQIEIKFQSKVQFQSVSSENCVCAAANSRACWHSQHSDREMLLNFVNNDDEKYIA
jgi:transmembrane 9 superfamily protein 3